MNNEYEPKLGLIATRPAATVLVRKNEYGEYEVPAPTPEEIYFTDDRDDALGTALIIHGDNASVKVARGTYARGHSHA